MRRREHITRREALRRLVRGAAYVAAPLIGQAVFCCGRALAETDAGIPAWVVWHESDAAFDLGGGATGVLSLHDRCLSFRLSDDASPLFETPADWQVSDAFTGDVDRDGVRDVSCIVWKRGSFGSARPFWIEDEELERDESVYSQHLFIYRLSDGELRPLWMSSSLGFEARETRLLDDGVFRIETDGGKTTYWQWQGWGLTLLESHLDQGVAEKASTTRATFALFGDNIAHANVYEGAYDPQTRTFDFSPIYEHVRPFVESFDVAAVVQETPFVEDPSRRSSYPEFATPCSLADALAKAGFDVALSATNHANDQGQRGLECTLSYWRNNHPEVAVVGVHGPDDQDAGGSTGRIVEANGIKVALFAYTYGLNGHGLPPGSPYRIDTLDDKDRLLFDVATARPQADAVVCYLHIGNEYQAEATQEQAALCAELIDAGADAVVCSHTHVLGPYGRMRTENGREGIVFFGLGNFVSGQGDRVETAVGGAAVLVFEKTVRGDGTSEVALVEHRLEPTICHDDGRGSVCAYLLRDYTDELAAQHRAGAPDDSLTVERAREAVPLERPFTASM